MAESQSQKKLYEGLFLMDQAGIAGDLSGALAHVQAMFDRAEAEVLALRKWDERKLAYPIKNQKRGTYLLALFRVNPVQIANIERDCNLSEQVLRVLFTRGDHMGEIEIEQALAEAKTTADEVKLREGGGDEGAASAQAAKQTEPAEAAAGNAGEQPAGESAESAG